MTEKIIPLEHPGIILKKNSWSLSVYQPIGFPKIQASQIWRSVKSYVEKRSITPRVGIRLSKYFGVSEGYFSRLQLQYDLDLIKEKEGNEVDKIHKLIPSNQLNQSILSC